jgi:hypothetical protein
MNKYESILAGGVVALFVVVLIIRAVVKVFETLVSVVGSGVSTLFDGVGAFFALAPPWFWGLVVMIAVIGGLVYLALWAYHSIAKMRNESAIVEVQARRAFVLQNGAATAVSFEGQEITTRRIERPYTLTSDEEKILLKMQERRRVEDAAFLNLVEYKGGGHRE